MPASRMKPGEDGRDADARVPQVLAQPEREPAQPELGRRVDRAARARRLARQRGDEHEVAAAARDHALGQRPRQHDRRAQVDVERAVDLLDAERLEHARWPGAPRWRRARRRRRHSPSRRVDRARSARSHATARPPISAASGSSTSARRPVSTSRAPRAASARAIAWPMPPVAPVSSTRPRPSEVHRAKTATVAVKPCRKYSPPTGPISPAAKKPAAGAPPSSAADRLGVVVAARRTSRGRGRCTRTQRARRRAARPAPPSARSSASRRSRSALVGVARVQPHDLAGPHLGAERDLAGVGIGAHEPADEEVALHVVGLVVVDHDPHQQPAVRPGRGRRRRAPRSPRAACRAPACRPARR